MRAVIARYRIAIAGALVVLAVAATWSFAEDVRYAKEPARIAVQAAPISSFDLRDPNRVRFGALEFRGGLELTSPHPAFGGISGLLMKPDGENFIAVTDNGSWLTGHISYGDGGEPAVISDLEIAPVLGPDGTPLAAKGWFDLEALAQDANGMLYVGIERVEQIVRFDFKRDGVAARGIPIPVPDDFKSFTFNKSLECIAVLPDNTLVVITERSLDAQGNHRSYLLNGSSVQRFSVKRSDDYDVSDCAMLSPATMLLLERRYSPARGVAIRIRKLAVASFTKGAPVDGPILMEADIGYQIDNMEGLGIHKNARGETILTLISDDNFSAVQRNLLLQFALIGE